MVTRLPEEVRIVVNAAGREKDLALLRALCPRLSFELRSRADRAPGTGGRSRVLAIEAGITRLAFMQAAAFGELFVSRSATPARTASKSPFPMSKPGLWCASFSPIRK